MRFLRTLAPAAAVMTAALTAAMPAHGSTSDQTIVEIAAADGRFETLVTAVGLAGLVDTLNSEGPFTVFAPTDAAFSALPEGALDGLIADPEALRNVLLYHVVAGVAVDAATAVTLTEATMANDQDVKLEVREGSLFVNEAKVIITDIFASNGVIHVLDAVLLPPAAAEPELNIIETARQAGAFNTLLTAIDVAGLTDTLASGGPFTVFAPTDEAFAKIPADALAALLADVPALTNVLLFHVTDGERLAQDVLSQSSLPMLNGSEAAISTCNKATIAGAKIVATDIQTSNGVIHVISDVIFP